MAEIVLGRVAHTEAIEVGQNVLLGQMGILATAQKGVEPPVSPVFDAWMMVIVSAALQAISTSQSSSKVPGLTTAIAGSGRVASLLPYTYAAVRKFGKILIWDIHEQGARTLAQKLIDDGFNAEAVNALEPAVRQADIITAATLSNQPLVLGAWVKPGTHVDLIGAFTPRMRESDGSLLQKASIFIDTEEAMIEGGDIVASIKEGFIGRDAVKGTLEQICSGTVSTRQSEIQITCFKAVGTALADLAAASLVYETMPAS